MSAQKRRPILYLERTRSPFSNMIDDKERYTGGSSVFESPILENLDLQCKRSMDRTSGPNCQAQPRQVSSKTMKRRRPLWMESREESGAYRFAVEVMAVELAMLGAFQKSCFEGSFPAAACSFV